MKMDTNTKKTTKRRYPALNKIFRGPPKTGAEEPVPNSAGNRKTAMDVITIPCLFVPGLAVAGLNLLLKPLSSFAGGAEKIVGGDYTFTLPEVKWRKLNVLFRSFNRMRRNIWEREEKLRESETKYRMLFGKMMDGFALHRMVYDRDDQPVDYIFLEVNSAFEELTGLNREAIIGKKVTRVLPGIEYSAFDWIGKYGEVAETGKELRVEQQFSEPLRRWYSVRAFSPQKGHFATIFEDVTPRKEAERKLQEAHNILEKRVRERTAQLAEINESLEKEIMFRQEVENALAAEKELLSVTLAGMQEGVIITGPFEEIILINRAASVITAWPADQTTGRPLTTALYILEDSRDGLFHTSPATLMMDYREAGRQMKRYTIKTKAGHKKIISGSAAPIYKTNNDLLGYVIVFRDITETTRQEAQQALSQKLESIGQLAAGIAHEINSPMQYINDNIHLLREAFEQIVDYHVFCRIFLEEQAAEHPVPGNDLSARLQKHEESYDLDLLLPEVPRAIEEALDGIERVTHLIKDMNEFIHPGGHKLVEANINRAVERVVAITKNEWKKVAEITCKLAVNLPPVSCDITKINQVLLNILINAIQAIDGDVRTDGQKGVAGRGQINIKTGMDKEGVFIIIQDDGPGIREEHRDRIFDPFFTTKEVGEGTGQGLPIAHNIIVNNHGGSLQLETAPGEGTSFVIKLPAAGC